MGRETNILKIIPFFLQVAGNAQIAEYLLVPRLRQENLY